MSCHIRTEKDHEEMEKLRPLQKRLEKEFNTIMPVFKEEDLLQYDSFLSKNPRIQIVRDSLEIINIRLYELFYGKKPPYL